MIDGHRARICLAFIIIVSTIGAIDALFGRVWDLALLLSLAAVSATVGVWPSRRDRSVVSARRDLVQWIQRRAAIEGESVGQVTDRAIATYRSQWTSRSDLLP